MKERGLLLLGILLTSLCQVSTKQYKCPNIHVAKNEIIQVKESLKAGAEFLSSKKTPDAHECYQLCCDEKRCDLAQLQYKNNASRGEVERVERTCYLFQCGHPTKCSFRHHDHHATIHFAKREEVKSAVNPKRPQQHTGGCSPGVPEAMCLVNPCLGATCPANQYATCRPNLCGFCHAEFFDDDGVKVDCHAVDKETDLEEKDLETTYEQGQKEVGEEVDHRSKMFAVKMSLPTKKPVYRLVKTTTKVLLKHPDVHNSGVDKFSIEEFENTLHKLNPAKEKTAPPTVKPTVAEEPTTFHHWREFVDNNPNFPLPTRKKEVFQVNWESKSTPPPTEKETTTKIYPPTEKEMPVEKYPAIEEKPSVEKESSHKEELPTKKATPVEGQRNDIPQVSPPVIQRKLHKNVTDIVLIENNHLKIVENKAVLPLAIFLVVAILLLFIVALRLRVVKNKLRRRPFATDDADYLINGMYL